MSTAYPRRLARGMLASGMVLSIVANGLHADPNPIAVVIAAIPPVTLWATLELVIRLPLRRRLWAWAQKAVTLFLAGVAAYVSYSHIREVCLRYGEDATIAGLVPLCIDGMILAGSLGLIEIRAEDQERVPVPEDVPAEPVPAVPGNAEPETVPVLVPVPAGTAARTASSDDDLLAELRRVTAEHGVPTVREVRARFSVGATRAQRLLAQVGTPEPEMVEA